MPAAVTAAATATPTVASNNTTGRSFLNSRHPMNSAASNTRGGRNTLKISSFERRHLM